MVGTMSCPLPATPSPANQYKVSYDYVANFTAAPQLNSNSG